jgi:hypothetical protein
MVDAAHARRKVRATAVNVVARRVGIAAIGGSARICGTGVRQHIFQMVRATHARRKARAAAVNVVARRVGIAAVGGSARICGTGVRQHIFQMIRAANARRKVRAAAVNVVARRVGIASTPEQRVTGVTGGRNLIDARRTRDRSRVGTVATCSTRTARTSVQPVTSLTGGRNLIDTRRTRDRSRIGTVATCAAIVAIGNVIINSRSMLSNWASFTGSCIVKWVQSGLCHEVTGGAAS